MILFLAALAALYLLLSFIHSFTMFNYKIHHKILGWVRPSPPFWQCQDFGSAYYCNQSLTRCENVGKPKRSGCGKKSKGGERKTYYGEKKEKKQTEKKKGQNENKWTEDEIRKQNSKDWKTAGGERGEKKNRQRDNEMTKQKGEKANRGEKNRQTDNETAKQERKDMKILDLRGEKEEKRKTDDEMADGEMKSQKTGDDITKQKRRIRTDKKPLQAWIENVLEKPRWVLV